MLTDFTYVIHKIMLGLVLMELQTANNILLIKYIVSYLIYNKLSLSAKPKNKIQN